MIETPIHDYKNLLAILFRVGEDWMKEKTIMEMMKRVRLSGIGRRFIPIIVELTIIQQAVNDVHDYWSKIVHL